MSWLLVSVMLTGCAKTNEIKLVNSGKLDWQHIEISAGGLEWKREHLKAGASWQVRFKTIKEDGGHLKAELNGETIQSRFGYFTPGMAEDLEIILNDQGHVEVKHVSP